MNFTEYQNLSKRTLNNKLDMLDAVVNYSMGLAGEGGEVLECVKKIRFHGHPVKVERLAEEIGDVLFYAAALCTELGLDMGTVAQRNVDKLKARYPNGFSEEMSRSRKEVGEQIG